MSSPFHLPCPTSDHRGQRWVEVGASKVSYHDREEALTSDCESRMLHRRLCDPFYTSNYAQRRCPPPDLSSQLPHLVLAASSPRSVPMSHLRPICRRPSCPSLASLPLQKTSTLREPTPVASSQQPPPYTTVSTAS